MKISIMEKVVFAESIIFLYQDTKELAQFKTRLSEVIMTWTLAKDTKKRLCLNNKQIIEITDQD